MVFEAYRPDDSPLSFFEDTLKPAYIQGLALNRPIVILGDLNCDDLDSTCREYAALNSFAREMNGRIYFGRRIIRLRHIMRLLKINTQTHKKVVDE